MPTALNALLAQWETSRSSPGVGPDARALSVKVSPEMADDLGRLAKELRISRPRLLSLIVHEGYAKVRSTLERVERQNGATADTTAANTAKPDVP